MTSCKACHHPNRAHVDEQLVRGVAIRAIAASSGLSLGGLVRHKEHIRAAIEDAAARAHGERGSALLTRIEGLLIDAEAVLALAKEKADLKNATAAIGACTRLLELLGKATGELQPAVNAGGIHFHAHKSVSVNVTAGDDRELAELIAEATNNFDPAVLERLRQLAEKTASIDVICNDRATPLLQR